MICVNTLKIHMNEVQFHIPLPHLIEEGGNIGKGSVWCSAKFIKRGWLADPFGFMTSNEPFERKPIFGQTRRLSGANKSSLTLRRLRCMSR